MIERTIDIFFPKNQKMSYEDDAIEVNDEQKTASEFVHNSKIEGKCTKLPRRRRSRNVRTEHRRRLIRLLGKLRKHHNWKEASGVLSVLLKGTCKETCLLRNHTKYLAAMELLNKINGNNISPTKIKRIYEIWMKRNGAMKKRPAEDKYLIQLESVLHRLTHENFEGAPFVWSIGEDEIRSDPVLNMMVGMIFYQQWYSSLPKEMKLRKFDPCISPAVSEISGMKSYSQSENTVGGNTIDVQDAESPIPCISDSSVGNYKQLDMNIANEVQKEKRNPLYQPQGFYMENCEEMSDHEEPAHPTYGDNMMDISIFRSYGLDASLLPVHLPQSNRNLENSISLQKKLLNDSYTKAVKHLRIALCSTPPALLSLLPLMQLLLLGDQVKEALVELENLYHLNAVLPLRLRASILEGFHGSYSQMLSSCYEDIMKKDPMNSSTLAKLITMHKNGDYSLEPLLEMISLHLDITYATPDVWGELASCFLKLAQCEEDQMSMCGNVDGSGDRQGFSVPSSMIPEAFKQGDLKMSWERRCRWWSNRHFSQNILVSETEAGDLQLSTCKAACASHMYGPEFDYVKNVRTSLEESESKEMTLFLQFHIQNSIKLLENLSTH